jgi:hypothetical protein
VAANAKKKCNKAVEKTLHTHMVPQKMMIRRKIYNFIFALKLFVWRDPKTPTAFINATRSKVHENMISNMRFGQKLFTFRVDLYIGNTLHSC